MTWKQHADSSLLFLKKEFGAICTTRVEGWKDRRTEGPERRMKGCWSRLCFYVGTDLFASRSTVYETD
jgi:hypothetical protein